jgi:cysteine desulfurase
MSDLIYLDHQATTPVDPRVVEAMLPYFAEHFGNPASVQHSAGVEAAEAVAVARRHVAMLLKADAGEILFVSGATEANNLALKGLAAGSHRRHIVTIATEHQAILDPVAALAEEGFEVSVLGVDRDGMPDLDELAGAVSEQTLVVSVAAANNEIGSLSPLRKIADIAHAHGALLHTDAAQAAGKIDMDVERHGVDLLSLSAHKFYGPKGAGALYVRRDAQRGLDPMMHGGAQEAGLRSGTLNVPGIVGLGAACKLAASEQAEEAAHVRELRDRFEDRLRVLLDGIELNGSSSSRLPGNLNLRFVGVDSEALMANCPDVAFSSGSACSAATPTPSHVLVAVGLSREAAEESARFGFGRHTTQSEVDAAVEQIAPAVRRIRRVSRTAVPS